jgi:hypothetical protein
MSISTINSQVEAALKASAGSQNKGSIQRGLESRRAASRFCACHLKPSQAR